MPHELTHEQNRVATVSSIIPKIFNPSKYWAVTIQPFWKTLFCSVPVLFIASFYFSTFIQCFCSIWCSLFDAMLLFISVLLISVWIIQCIFCSDRGNVFKVFRSRFTTTNKQSINIIQQTSPSLSLYRKWETFYNHRYRGISGTNFSIRVKQTARHTEWITKHCAALDLNTIPLASAVRTCPGAVRCHRLQDPGPGFRQQCSEGWTLYLPVHFRGKYVADLNSFV
jgi:hypothetical protein